MADPQKLFEEVAAAARLREGPEGVRAILEAVRVSHGAPLREISIAVRLPLPVTSAVRRELEKRDILTRQGGGMRLTAKGESLMQGKNVDITFAPASMAVRKTQAAGPEEIIATHKRIAESMPSVDVTLDQAFATSETAVKRAEYANSYNALAGRRVVFIGDDDLTAIAVALHLKNSGTAAASLTVLEIDKRINSVIREASAEHGLDIECVELDLRDEVPAALAGTFDVFFTDPPYTEPGLRLFLSRAASLMRPVPMLNGFLSLGGADPGTELAFQRVITDCGFAIRELIPDFNQYQGASMLGGVSRMLRLNTCGATAPVITGRHDEAIYTGEINRTTREYKCITCGHSENVGIDQKFITIEALKTAGCPACGEAKFKREGRVRFFGKTTPEDLEVERITPADAAVLRESFTRTGATAWCCYAPMLYFASDPPQREICQANLPGGGVTFLYRKQRGAGDKWDTYTIAPGAPGDLSAAVSIMDRLNGERNGIVMWLDEKNARSLAGEVPEFDLTLRDREYIYDSRLVTGLKGAGFDDVRKKINRFNREYDAVIMPFEPYDAAEAVEFASKWEAAYHARDIEAPLVDHTYTMRALREYGTYGAPDMHGWLARIGGRIVAVSLAGEMREGLACFFVLKTDLDIRGLATYMRWVTIARLAEMGYNRVNDASDLNLAGLRRHKSKFRPVEMLPIYKCARTAPRKKDNK